MAIEMVLFDFREEEKAFFVNNKFPNFNFTFFEWSLTPESVRKLPEDIKNKTSIISVFTDSDVSADVINEFKNLRIISTRSTSYNHISQGAATKRNIAVINVANYGEKSVAQFTFALILALVRKLLPASDGKFLSRQDLIGRDITELSIGIAGTGAIGASVCKIARFFNMKIYGYDIKQKQELVDKYNIEYLSLEDLLAKSDIITLHLPYTGENFHMFSDSQFEIIKQGAYFINTSSSKLVNLKSLYNAVEFGKIAGAALDFTVCAAGNPDCYMLKNPSEICREENKYLTLLKNQDNVIITPHVAYDTKESVNYILKTTINKIKHAMQCGDVYGVY